MPPQSGRVTERSFYPVLIGELQKHGGAGVSEVTFNSEPDIVFELLNRKWLLSVKLGESSRVLKEAFLQYQRHKDESGLAHGLLLFLPDDLRDLQPEEQALSQAIATTRVACLVDTPNLKEEYRDLSFSGIIGRILTEVGPGLARDLRHGYPLKLVISLLQEHVTELIGAVTLNDPMLLQVITDRQLLSSIGHLQTKDAELVARFLASYIALSQILFLRLFSHARPDVLPPDLRPVTHHSLRKAFGRVLKIDYRPIYAIDVLDALPEAYVRDTFDLIWGLQVEQIRHELPGRIFHELMPSGIRKMLAAFYTRPHAADLLACLAIQRSDDTVFDPACGSGTILVSAYKRKAELFYAEGRAGNPHKRFCEEEIYGGDIMPFAVHLAGSNLAAMEPGTAIERTQIMHGDSLQLSIGAVSSTGIQLVMFPTPRQAEDTSGERYNVNLKKVRTVLMNPPFTKVERGISEYVEMSRFRPIVGGEVGLWGHFVLLADQFLEEQGIFGGVIPISLLRGRESSRVRDFVFKNWTPLYILKPTLNYGFSEWAEYRDILFIARKEPAPPDHRVKFCLIKQDLTTLADDDVHHIVTQVKSLGYLRDPKLDIESFTIDELMERSGNMMWFCGVTDFRHRDVLVRFLSKFSHRLRLFPEGYFATGHRTEGKASSFLYLTRALNQARIEEAFLWFNEESSSTVRACSDLGVEYEIERDALRPSLRTGIGIDSMDLHGKWDYVAKRPYRKLRQVMRACDVPESSNPEEFWSGIETQLDAVSTHGVVVRRTNPYSPNTYLVAFASGEPISPADQLNIIEEANWDRVRATCTVLNSVLFLSCLFLSKEETTGRYIDVRLYDLYEMPLFPSDDVVPALARVYDDFARCPFPSLRCQLDESFDERYDEFWSEQRGQPSLFKALTKPVRPSPQRLALDLAVTRALGVSVSEAELLDVYSAIVKEMIVTRGLQRD